MKFFSWVKNKIHGKDNTIKPEPESSPSYHHCKEEMTSCSSSTLLSIGTFGNNLKDLDKANEHASTSSSNPQEISPSTEDDHHLEFEKELRLLLNEHASTSSGESEHFDLPIEKMLESLPVHEEIEKEIAIILQTTGKDIPSCTKKSSSSSSSSIYRKSLSFLLKKAFLCRGGFAPSPSPVFKDPFPDTKLDRSTMEKILKAVLRKKKHPQRQKYLEKIRTSNEEEQGEASSNANNWVKSDSEYIFLDL